MREVCMGGEGGRVDYNSFILRKIILQVIGIFVAYLFQFFISTYNYGYSQTSKKEGWV